MAKARIVNIVATECSPENDARFNKWYDEVHIPMLLKYKGIKKVTRYRMIDNKEKKQKYLAIYEYNDKKALDAFRESPEFKAAMEEMQGTWKGEMPDIKWAASYEPINTWER